MVLLSSALVFFMQAGFAIFAAGLIRAKNSLSLLAGSFIDVCLGSLIFYIFGYALMFGDGGALNHLVGAEGFFLLGARELHRGLPVEAGWLFHATFCAAAATICAGAMAGRLRFSAYLLLTAWICGVVYPVAGHWNWGGGWLHTMGFHDLAGSAQVHLLGGTIALWGSCRIGPRIGRYDKLGRPRIIQGHSLPLSVLGTFILWFGWFGFNIGSALTLAEGPGLARIAINTHLGACAGAFCALAISWIRFRIPDLTMALNGCLAGLVSITACCDIVEPFAALSIGLAGGALTAFSIPLLDRLRIDDPVGAVPVHGLAGIWGCLAPGFLAHPDLAERAGLLYGGGLQFLSIQLIGIIAVILWTSLTIWPALLAVDKLVGLRLPPEAELRGLDIEEFGNEAYNDFQVFSH